MSPDGEASCSHNAVVIPPAHGALAPVNTLPIVSWASFTPLTPPAIPQAHGLQSWPGFILMSVHVQSALSTGQEKSCVVIMISDDQQYARASVEW